MNNRKSEQGQALVLIVLGIVALLGFAALAIDGGRIYADRRNAQNASDTASLGGAAEIADYMASHGIYAWTNWGNCGTWLLAAKPSAYSAAIDRAFSNGFVIDSDASDKNGVTAVCGSQSYPGFTDVWVDVTTYITTNTQMSFAQFVFKGPLQQTVESTARIRPQTSVGYGNAIIALNELACDGNNNGFISSGNNSAYVDGGGIFSNGCFRANGNVTVDINDGSNTYIGSGNYIANGGVSVSPMPLPGTEPLPASTFDIPAPNCGALSARTWPPGDGTAQPGIYSSITHVAGRNVTMQAGLYCVQGDFRINGGTVIGNGVTIYLISGGLAVQGNPVIQLSAPPSINPAPYTIPGVVIYMAKGNTNEVDLLGDSGSSFQGTVYAPDGDVVVGGTAGISPTFSTQIIGYNVTTTGTANINIVFDDTLVFNFPPRLDLLK